MSAPQRSKKTTGPRRKGAKWSHAVTTRSNALDLEPGVFKKASPKAIATSVKRAADASRRRGTSAFRSAMSMLTFYVNRAGRSLDHGRRRVLERAKEELRRLFGSGAPAKARPGRTRHA